MFLLLNKTFNLRFLDLLFSDMTLRFSVDSRHLEEIDYPVTYRHTPKEMESSKYSTCFWLKTVCNAP